MRRTAVACALVVIAVPAGGASPAVAAERYTIRVSGSSISSIGDLRGRFTLGAAIRQFGRPASLTPTGFSCRLEWRRLRLRAEFVDLGASRPCDPAFGALQTATVRGSRFGTQRGLRVGDSTARLRRLHPGAVFTDGAWWLHTAPCVFGDCEEGERVPIVRAIVSGGRVRALGLFVGAAGE
jgi:hypothetical protein